MRFLMRVIVAVACTWPTTVWGQAASGGVPSTSQQPTTGQTAPVAGRTQPTLCGQAVPPPRRLPPAGSNPVVYFIAPCFQKQGGSSVIEPETYLYYIQLRPSRPSDDFWVPYTEDTEKQILDDFTRLWGTNFLDDLSIDVEDYVFENGVIGKLVTYNMEERQRVKIVEYTGSKILESTKIDEKLREENALIRLDSFIDQGMVRRVEGVIRSMLAEKGYLDPTVGHEIKSVSGGPKLVNIAFTIAEGPKIRLQSVDFIGNSAFSDGRLKRRMKENKARGFLSFLTGGGTYQEQKFADDAEKVVEYYRDRGYIGVRVGTPELKKLSDSPDGKTRWVELRIPVTEGRRYRIGDFTFDGNTVVKSEGLRPLFKVKPGKFYTEKGIRKGMEKARELYGSGGYFEFTGFPDLKPRDGANVSGEESADTPAPAPPAATTGAAGEAPVVDVVMRLQEGKQYFVNRITFTGNTTTRDNVIRRELRLYENGVFNTEALKNSVRRLNQLGYFKQLEGNAVGVDKTPGKDNQVDVKLKLEEQNRNQLTFGAGVSQWEGFFGQLSFQTANFLGRGETVTLSVQAGSRAHNYQVAFTEPFLFDRPITAGVDVFRRDLRYIGQFTQASTGANLSMGFGLGNWSRLFLVYSFEHVNVSEVNDLYRQPAVLARNPFLADALLIGQGGARTISKVVPSFVYNTVDNPIFPNTGRRYTASFDVAGLGGNTAFIKPRLEGVWYFQQSRKTSFGFRGQFEYIKPYKGTTVLPLFERLFLGGEYSIRGYDIRSVGPSDPVTGLVLGGNKSMLFNAEYLISIAGPVRLVLFYDAGQVRDLGKSFGWKEDITELVQPAAPLLTDPFAAISLTDPGAPGPTSIVTGQRSAFKTSTGAEVRFFMPVLNVPFRLIFSLNPQRGGVLDNNLRPAKQFTFRFAVGSTF
ncbi:MAG: BamA/TamA family outer membrane protein [Vicinamibacterales bacterium]